jgi:hypothetical protein
MSATAELTLKLPSGHQRREELGSARGPRERGSCAGGGRLTLEERLSSVWEGLLAAGQAECPVCGERMERQPHMPAGACAGCGTALS